MNKKRKRHSALRLVACWAGTGPGGRRLSIRRLRRPALDRGRASPPLNCVCEGRLLILSGQPRKPLGERGVKCAAIAQATG